MIMIDDDKINKDDDNDWNNKINDYICGNNK